MVAQDQEVNPKSTNCGESSTANAEAAPPGALGLWGVACGTQEKNLITMVSQ